MKILVFKRCDDNYDHDTCRYDNLRILGDFLSNLCYMPFSYFKTWAVNPEPDYIEDEYFHMVVKKSKNILTITELDSSEEELTNEILDIPREPFQESAEKIVKLAEDLYNMMKQENAPEEIALMYHQNEYYLKVIPLRCVSFRKLSRKEFPHQEIYASQGFFNGNTLGALGKFFVRTVEFFPFLEWLKDSQLAEISTSIGKLIRHTTCVTVIYDKPEYSIYMTTILSIKTFIKLIEYYQQFTAQELEGFLLIEEPEQYIFMTNPFEEIKIPKEKL